MNKPATRPIEPRGHLNPGDSGVRLERFTIGLDPLVRHVWIARWDIPKGQVRPQRVLGYPACNIVVMPDSAFLHGPDPAIGVRELSGRSWAVGILLRPAGAQALTDTPAHQLVASHEPMPTAPRDAITAAMDNDAGTGEHLPEVLAGWLAPLADGIDAAGHTINEVCRIAEERDDVVRVAQLAELTGISTHTLARRVRHRIGVTPKWLIECRRLQRAATTLYTQPDSDLASLAHTLGYADQAHFTRRYRQVLGETPDQTRRAGSRRPR